MLEEKGFSGIEKLYISCQYGVSKKTKLFCHVLEQENFSPEKILHFGDHPVRDGAVPHKMGISVCICEHQQTVPAEISLKKFSGPGKLLHNICSNIAAALPEPEEKLNIWYHLGTLAGGNLILSFASHCMETARQKQCKDILFVARDGYLPWKAIELLMEKDEFSCHYVYAPRAMSYPLAFEKEDLGKHGLDTYLDIFENNTDCIFPRDIRRKTWQEKRIFIQKNWHYLDEIRENMNREFKLYSEMLAEKISSDKILLIDGVSGKYSAEKLLRKYYPDKKIFAAYWQCNQTENNFRNSYISAGTISIEPLSLLERMLSAPYPVAVNIKNGEPVFNASADGELIAQNFRYFAKGTLDFIKEIKQYYHNLKDLFSEKTSVLFVNMLIDHLTIEYIRKLQGELCPAGALEKRFRSLGGKIYRPLINLRNFSVFWRKSPVSCTCIISFGKHCWYLRRIKKKYR